MTERERLGKQNELTMKPNSSNLREEGVILMSENGEGQKPRTEDPGRKREQDINAARNSFLLSLGGRRPTFQEEQTLRAMSDAAGPQTGTEGQPAVSQDVSLGRQPETESPRELTEEEMVIRDDIEGVYNLSSEMLTPKALAYLDRLTAEDTMGELRITKKVRKILRKNGISKDLVDKYQSDRPEVLAAMLFARRESHRNYQQEQQRAAQREPSRHKEEEVPTEPPPPPGDGGEGDDGGGGEPPTTTPAGPTPEEPEEEHEEPSVRAEDLVARLTIERTAGAKKLLDSISAQFDDPEIRRIWREAGLEMGDTRTILRQIMDLSELEKATARNKEEESLFMFPNLSKSLLSLL